MSTPCPLVIANRTCLSRCPLPSPPWKRRIKAGRKRRKAKATSRRSLNRTPLLPRFQRRFQRRGWLACQLYSDLFAAHRVSVALNSSTTTPPHPCLHRFEGTMSSFPSLLSIHRLSSRRRKISSNYRLPLSIYRFVNSILLETKFLEKLFGEKFINFQSVRLIYLLSLRGE